MAMCVGMGRPVQTQTVHTTAHVPLVGKDKAAIQVCVSADVGMNIQRQHCMGLLSV